MSKRNQFIKRKNLKENLKKYNAFSLNGYYPLFNTIEDATSVSPVSSYHTHKFENIEYHMPDGLDMGRTQFHGDYNDETTRSNRNTIRSYHNYTATCSYSRTRTRTNIYSTVNDYKVKR